MSEMTTFWIISTFVVLFGIAIILAGIMGHVEDHGWRNLFSVKPWRERSLVYKVYSVSVLVGVGTLLVYALVNTFYPGRQAPVGVARRGRRVQPYRGLPVTLRVARRFGQVEL